MENMKTACILAAGQGSRLWPYATIRPKAMTPVGAVPLVKHTVASLKGLGFDRIVIAANHLTSQISGCFLDDPQIEVVDTGPNQGSAQTLLQVLARLGRERFLVLYGDTLYDPQILDAYYSFAAQSDLSVLCAELESETAGEQICLNLTADGCLGEVSGHPRGGYRYKFAGFILDGRIGKYLAGNPGYFSQVEVGVMSPLEHFLELSVYTLSKSAAIRAFQCQASQAIDIDKPWQILCANTAYAQRTCARLDHNILEEGSSICASAKIDGFVRLGKNSRIGHQVIIKGNVIIADNTTIENGALLFGNNIIGSKSYLANYCYIDHGTVIGNGCVVNHCAEMDGILFDGVYLYHYMEIYGIIGEHTDIGAATVCGSLRFDDGDTLHTIKGRKERPAHFANATYIGDFCRTGVNVIIAPGKRIGCYSVLGAGTLLDRDVPDNTLLYPRQELVEKKWGPHRYGW